MRSRFFHNNQRGITKKGLYVTHRHDLLHIPLKFNENIYSEKQLKDIKIILTI